MSEIETRKAEARAWFESLQAAIFAMFEGLEDEADPALYPGAPGRFVPTPWSRPAAADGADQGGGRMGMMRGRLFEKVGVHTSTVFGRFSPDFAGQIKGAAQDPRFWASGISLICHPRNPHVPAVHMNTRMIVTTESWFGGGADLNPTLDAQRDRAHPDAQLFHQRFKATCDAFDAGWYPKYEKWAEDYFWLPHRGEPRGVGGIFYDHMECADQAEWEANFAFTRAVGEAFLAVFPRIVRRRMGMSFTPAEKAQQLEWRGRYAEFNLVYDRGTLFGLKTGGNIDAILMSLPPMARWS